MADVLIERLDRADQNRAAVRLLARYVERANALAFELSMDLPQPIPKWLDQTISALNKAEHTLARVKRIAGGRRRG